MLYGMLSSDVYWRMKTTTVWLNWSSDVLGLCATIPISCWLFPIGRGERGELKGKGEKRSDDKYLQ